MKRARVVSMLQPADHIVEELSAKTSSLRRWDGTRRSSKSWKPMPRDPDLWMPDGSCLIYFYTKGCSNRSPSFKLPFSKLVAAQCFPFIEQFLVTEGFRPRSASEIRRWHKLNPRRTAELYIPLPPRLDHEKSLAYYLVTRNFLAWVVGKPLVGEQLGSALVALLCSMQEFRSHVEDDVKDLFDYLDKTGYLALAHQPDHAMALLFLAESFRLRQPYIRAFAHCVGMNEHLRHRPDYCNISPFSRKLIRQARQDMDVRLSRTSFMLGNFLEDHLLDSQVDISPGAQAHLERFRSFLLSFYSAKLGYYPPELFQAEAYRSMGDDFAALYELLKDEEHTYHDQLPTSLVGGLSLARLLRSFDGRHRLGPLEYPFPKLPQPDEHIRAKRLSWLSFGSLKSTTEQREAEHVALVTASNCRPALLQNDLVRAYQNFEKDWTLSPNKADKHEKVTLVEARKVRWLLIYAIHQLLRHANTRPAEVSQEAPAAYPLAVSTENLPPWGRNNKMADLVPSPILAMAKEMGFADRSTDIASSYGSSTGIQTNHTGTRPIDVSNKESSAHRGSRFSIPNLLERAGSQSLPRASSMSWGVLNRNSKIYQKSVRLFRRSVSSHSLLGRASSASLKTDCLIYSLGESPDEGSLGVTMASSSLGHRQSSSRGDGTDAHSDFSHPSVPGSASSMASTLASTASTPSSSSDASFGRQRLDPEHRRRRSRIRSLLVDGEATAPRGARAAASEARCRSFHPFTRIASLESVADEERRTLRSMSCDWTAVRAPSDDALDADPKTVSVDWAARLHLDALQ